MKKIKALVALALASTVALSSSITVRADVDGFVIKDSEANELYQYYEEDILDSLKNQKNWGEDDSLYEEFIKKVKENGFYLIRDDSGKYLSYDEGLKEFERKKANGEAFDVDQYYSNAEAVDDPEYLYERREKKGEVVNQLNLIKDNLKSNFKKDKFKYFEDLKITGDNITILNADIKGNLTLDPGKNGTTNVENVKAEEISVLSGGENSIHLLNVNAKTLGINSDEKVRVETKGTTKIGNTKVNTYAILDAISGDYGEIRIAIKEDEKGSKEKTVELRGEFWKPIILESGATLKAAKGSVISKVEIAPKNKNEQIKLEGTFKDVTVSKNAILDLGENTEITKIKAIADVEFKGDKTSKILKLETLEGVKVLKNNVKVSENTEIKKKDEADALSGATKDSSGGSHNTGNSNNGNNSGNGSSSGNSNNGNNSGNGGSSGNSNNGNNSGNSNNGNNSGNGDSSHNGKIIDSSKTRIMEIENVIYAVITLKEGTADNYEFFIDGKKIDIEKVNTKGTIVKFELKDSLDKTLVIKNGDNQEEILLKLGSSNSVDEEKESEIKLVYSSDRFVESNKNDGSISEVIDVTLQSSDDEVEFVDTLSAATFSKMPKGLTLKEKKINDKQLRFYVEGKAENHNDTDDIVLKMEFTKEIFKNLKSDAKLIDLVKEIKIDFKDEENKNEGKIIDTSKTKIMEIENVIYAVITLKEGTAEDYEFFIDGKKADLEKVNIQGTILKVELNQLKDTELLVKNQNIEEKLTLNK